MATPVQPLAQPAIRSKAAEQRISALETAVRTDRAKAAESAKSSYLTSPTYNYAWAALGGPLDKPAPRPFHSTIGTQRGMLVHGSTVPELVTVAAGSTCVLFVDPFSRQGPARYFNGTAPATATVSWDHTQEVGQDKSAAAGGSAFVAWRSYCPYTIVEDSDSYSGAGNEYNAPNASRHPPIIQTAATTLAAEVALPYGGTCSIAYSSGGDGDAGYKLGGEKSYSYGAGSASVSHPMAHPAFKGALQHATQLSGALTPQGFCNQTGNLELLVGPVTKTYSVVGLPDETWHYAGDLPVATAADAGYVQVGEGFMPRNNIASRGKYGMIVITNTGANNAQVKISCSVALHVVIQSDTSDRTIAPIMTAIYSKARPLTAHIGDGVGPAPKSHAATGSVAPHPSAVAMPGHTHQGEVGAKPPSGDNIAVRQEREAARSWTLAGFAGGVRDILLGGFKFGSKIAEAYSARANAVPNETRAIGDAVARIAGRPARSGPVVEEMD